jgi:hypothetical protein
MYLADENCTTEAGSLSSNTCMLHISKLRAAIVAGLLIAAPAWVRAQGSSARETVRAVMKNELAADANDHTHWMFKESKKVPGKSTVKLVVETPKGNVSRVLEIDGQPPTAEQRARDEANMQKLISDPQEQQKQARDRRDDGKQARNMMKMLPDAFLWTKTGEASGVGSFKFRPNPDFDPPTREAQVLAAMAGTMTIDQRQMRMKSLNGELTKDVEFGWGILGRLRKGGTFSIERAEIAPKVWQITATHVHISGRALLFKSIDQNEDELTSDYKRVPDSLSLQEAAALLKKDGAENAQNIKSNNWKPAKREVASDIH